MKSGIFVVVLVLLMSCSSSQNIIKTDSPDRYKIRVDSQSFSSLEKTKKAFHKNASKACSGKDYRKVGLPSASTKKVPTENGYSRVLVTTFTIKCLG